MGKLRLQTDPCSTNQDSVGGGKGDMAWRATKRPIAYRTTARTPIRETPFRLAFKSEAVIPAEVGIASYKIAHHDERKNEEGIRLHLDLLDKVGVAAEQRVTRYQDLIAKHYNAKVKPWHFNIGDLVLRKVTTTTRDPTQGKLRPN